MRNLAFFGAIVLSAASQALSLTGINGTPTDNAGNWHTGWYNTFGGDAGKNLYVAMETPSGAFINSGNNGLTMIDVDLQPGTYRIYGFFDGNEIFTGRDFWGVNLFFQGDDQAPGISAFGVPRSFGEGDPTFQKSSGTTKNLEGDLSVSAADSLSFTDGTLTATLTRLATNKIEVFNMDRVQWFTTGANARRDHVVELELAVVPEPATLAALALAAPMLLRRNRRKS